jgi:putative FmdB family regulatory protein
MPTYAYKCRDCGTPLEVHQEFSDAPLTVCPTCGGTLRKQYGSVGVTFNGSGFYRTDSRAGSESKPSDGAKCGSADSGSSSKSDGGSAAKPESSPKPAATPAS